VLLTHCTTLTLAGTSPTPPTPLKDCAHLGFHIGPVLGPPASATALGSWLAKPLANSSWLVGAKGRDAELAVHLVVTSVAVHSDAWNKGVGVGWVLISVDGKYATRENEENAAAKHSCDLLLGEVDKMATCVFQVLLTCC
jgi:hypothetical protein